MGQSLGKWIGQTISSLRATSTFPALTAPSVIALLCPLEALAQDSPQPADALIVTAAYTGEVNSVLHGGVSSASHYLDNLDLQAEADLEQLLGWQGARAFAYGLYNNGAAFSPAVGDAFVTSNIETGTQALRLYELWLEQQLAPGASVRIGLYDLNSEFDALDASALFLASAHGIGVDISQSGLNGPSIFPSTSVAARLAIAVDRDWQLRLAVLDGVPGDPDHPARTAVQLGNGDGALLIGEVERHLDAGKVLAGHWRYTGGFDRFDGTRSHGNHGYYLRGEHQLLREVDDAAQGLAGFFRLGTAAGGINGFDRFASIGITYRGPFAMRDEDDLGLALASGRTSAAYRRFAGAGSHETAFELTYRAVLTPWLALQPDLQYVINPGAGLANGNALVGSLRAEIGWEFR
jgi:porin